jgi:hypothetical protein
MWQIILNAILKEIQSNPDRVLTLIEEIVGILKSNPTAVNVLVHMIGNQGNK